MELFIDMLQSFIGNVCVDLRCADVRMAKHKLNRTQVGAIFEQVRGKAVAQQMRRDMANFGAIPIFDNQLPESLPTDG